MKGTDMKGHLYVSLLKSVMRICAGVALFNMSFTFAAAFFILAEVLGITEEFV
jgi:hypothetical protein